MRIVRFGLSLVVSILMFRVLNTFNLPKCTDCFALVGLPFHYYQVGGVDGGGHWIVTGVVGDLACILVVGIGLGWMWDWLIRQQRRRGSA